MQDKKILAVLTTESDDSVLNSFITHFGAGTNIDMTLCCVKDDSSPACEGEHLSGRVTTTCTKKSIPLKVAEIHADAATAMRSRAPFADLVVVEKEVLRKLALRDELPRESGAILALPSRFSEITNVILLFDGTASGLRGIKEFFQVFARHTNKMEVTLLCIESDTYAFRKEEEMQLVEYIRRHSTEVGVLKVAPPLTDRHLRAVSHKAAPVVTGDLEYLIGLRGSAIGFKPFYDDTATLFIPSANR